MSRQAYFEKIHKQIAKRLNESSKSIFLAIAWLTDDKLFDILCDKARNGIDVQLLIANNDINKNSGIDFSKLEDSGGEIYWIGKNFTFAPLMHNKFCIIDNSVLIFGSYNWTKKARSNNESITIIKDDENLLLDYNQEFLKIKFSKIGKQDPLHWQTLLLRLNTLSNTIQLEDEEEILYQTEKLRSFIGKGSNSEFDDILLIVELCEEGAYRKATNKIKEFTSRHKKLTIFQDPEIPAIQLEIKSLELQVASLEDERTDIEKEISNFNERYNREFGELLSEILLLRKEAARKAAERDMENMNKQADYQEARWEYQNFSEEHKRSMKKPKPAELSKEDKDTLKKNYRQATKICHPDKVAEEHKDEAEKVFKNLKAAYEQNDLRTVTAILEDLERGNFRSRGENVTKKDKLLSILDNLLKVRKELEDDLSRIKNSDVYLRIQRIIDRDEFFKENKKKFLEILERLRKQKTGIYE